MEYLSLVPTVECIQNAFQTPSVSEAPLAIVKIAQKELLDEKEDLNQAQMTRLRMLVFAQIQILKPTTQNSFYVCLEKIFSIIKREFYFDCSKKAYLHGGEVPSILENEKCSNDVDVQYKVPGYTHKREIARIIEAVKNYFSIQSDMTVNEIIDKKILKVKVYWEEGVNKNRVYTLSFKDINGIKYDFSVVVELERDFLFYHDAMKIPLNSVLDNKIDKKIFPYNLLNGRNPLEYRQKKILQTDFPETINFSGCIRMISNYVKGYVCENEHLEEILLKSIFKLLETNPRYNLKNVVRRDIKHHHNNDYAASVAFAFNFITLILRQQEFRYYYTIRDIFVEILNRFSEQTLPKPLEDVKKVIIANGSLVSLASTFEAVSLSERKDITSTLYQYQVGEHYLLFQNVQKKKNDNKPIALNVKKTITYKQLVQEISEERFKWSPDTFVDDLNKFLQVNKKLSSKQHKNIRRYVKDVLKDLLNIDVKGEYCIPLCEHFINHAFSKKLEAETKGLLLKRWQYWVYIQDKDDRLKQIYTEFISTSPLEQSLHRMQAFLNNHSYDKARLIADKIHSNQIPSEIRLQLLEEKGEPHSFEELEDYITYQALILKSPKESLFKQRAKEAAGLLVKGKLTPHRIENLLKVGKHYTIVDGIFWSTLLLKALQNEKTAKGAIDIFFDAVVPCNLMVDNVEKLYDCWKTMFIKLGSLHEPILMKYIADPQPILDLCHVDSGFDSLPLLQVLNKEAFYLLKNTHLSQNDYKDFFEYLSKYATSEQDRHDFVTIFLLSPNQEYFMYALDQLEDVAKNLEYDKLEELCILADKRIPDFPNLNISRTLQILVYTRLYKEDPFKRFNLAATFARSCPSTQDLLPSVVDDWVSNLLAGRVGENNLWEYEQTVMVLIDLILITKKIDSADKISALLSMLPENCDLEILTKKKIWAFFISNYLCVFEEGHSIEEILIALDFFYASFHKVFGRIEYEKQCLEDYVKVLHCLFKLDFPLCIQQIDRFTDFLVGENSVWKFHKMDEEQNLENESFDVNFIKNFSVFPVTGGKICNEYLYTRFDQQVELDKSRLNYFDQWNRFSMGMTLLCYRLLLSAPIEKEHEKFILKFAYKGIEMLMNGERTLPVWIRGEIQKNIILLIDKYISRKGYLSAELFGSQMKNSSLLLRCGLDGEFIQKMSSVFVRYILYLNKNVVKFQSQTTFNYEHEFFELIELIVTQGHAYHLYRISVVMQELNDVMKEFSAEFRRKYKALLKSGIAKVSEDFKDCDGYPIGKTLKQIKF